MVDETGWLQGDKRKLVKTAVSKYADMAKERNGFIHYPFGFDSRTQPEFEIYKAKRSRSGDELHVREPMSPEKVMEFANKVRKLVDRITEAHRALLDARHESSQSPLSYPNLPDLSMLPRMFQEPSEEQ
jgi:hypothetical protein